MPFIGFLLLALYIWGRYIRHRLPRIIPYDLTLWQFLILISICCSYMYVIYRTFKPKIPPQIILDYILYISNILKAFDNYLKGFHVISYVYKKIFTFLAYKIDANNLNLWKKILIIIEILPPFILLFVLSIDTFYHHKLFYFYKAIWITLILLIVPFCLYSFNYIKESLITYWENNSEHVSIRYIQGILPPKQDYWHPEYEETDDDCYGPPGFIVIPFRTFIAFYVNEIKFKEIYFNETQPNCDYSVKPFMKWYNDFFEKYNLNWDSPSFHDIKYNIIKKDMDFIVQLSSILYSYNEITTKSKVPTILKYIKVLFYIGYIICWGYILSTSLYSVVNLSVLSQIFDIYINYNLLYTLKILTVSFIIKRINDYFKFKYIKNNEDKK